MSINWQCESPYVQVRLLDSMPRYYSREVQGDYWYSLPENIRNDKAKAMFISRYYPGYVVKYIWEHDLVQEDKVLELLLSWLGVK